MANMISLLEYLQVGPPEVPVINQGQSRQNTTNQQYNHSDISFIGFWDDFNRMPASSPPPITSENSLRRRCAFYLEAKVRRPLRRGFEWLEASGELGNWSVVSFGEGDLAQTPDNFVPDTAYFRPDLPARTRQNRAPGELKPSYKWSSSLRNSDNPVHQRKFRQPLSQVNWYMGQNNAQYGFLLTNNELVAIRRIDNGMLELSDSIPWTTSGNVTQPRLTVLLALWYLGMLASDNGPWQIQQ